MQLVSGKVKSGFFYTIMASIDYKFKSYVLKEHSDLIKRYKKAQLVQYCNDLYINDGIITKTFLNGNNETLNDIEFDCIINNRIKELNEVEKICKASIQRTKRLRTRIETILLSGNCLFLTLTFNDNTLNSTSIETRRKYVSRYLKSFNCLYVANIDFGSKNHREHYHAVVGLDNIDLSAWRTYGNINVQKVRNNSIELNKKRLSKYICKLSNHAIKETTKRSCLIYSR